jgi:adenylosuccinate synthase
LAPYVVDAIPFIKSVQDGNKKMLIEGANALMLDIDYGSYLSNCQWYSCTL